MLDVLSRLTDFLQGLLPSPWLWAVVFVISAMDALLPFMPSDTTIIVVGVLVVEHPMRLGLLVMIGAAGAFAGDLLGYIIGRRSGGMLSRMTRDERGLRRYQWVLRQLRRHGTLLILLARYVPGGRVATMLTAGALGYPTRRFLITEVIATVLWAAFFALLGYAGGETFAEHPAKGLLMAFAIGLVLAGLIEVGRRIVLRNRPKAPAATPAQLHAETEQTYTAA